VVGQQSADIAGTLHLRDVAMATIFFAFHIWGEHQHHLANRTEPSRMWRRCGLMSNYFDHLFFLS